MSSSSNPLVRAKRPTQPTPPLRRPNTSSSFREFVTVKTEEKPPVPQRTTEAPPASAANQASSQQGNYSDFVLRSCTSQEVKDKRHHILKFHSRSAVNPSTDFTPPIRFYRKDPRNLQFQPTISDLQSSNNNNLSNPLSSTASPDAAGGAGSTSTSGAGTVANASSSSSNKMEVDTSSIAPDGGRRKNLKPFTKKTRQVITGGVNNTDAAKRLRYEEYYPWVMEDFDGHNTWVGSYEAAQSDTYVLFVFDKDGFKMVPAEKWYKMTPRNKYATLTAEEAEERMEKKNKNVPRWIMKHLSEENGSMNEQRFGSSGGGGAAGGGAGGRLAAASSRRLKTVDNAGLSRPGRRDDDEDHDEIDYDEEFADDEEAPIMEGAEEDVKEVENKIKREQRNAKFINEVVEADEDTGSGQFDALFNAPGQKIDKEGRKLRKYLRSLEKNANYDSDDDETKNPYLSDEGEDEDESDENTMETDGDKKIKQEQQQQEHDNFMHIKKEDVLGLHRTSPPIVKKEYKNLPRGMVILQLRPQILASFPRDVWNPNAKRRRLDETNINGETTPTAKKVKISPPPTSAATPSSTAAAAADDANLLTEEDIRSIIATKRVTATELLGILKPKFVLHPGNRDRLKQLLRKMARLQNNYLVLKEDSSSPGR